MARERLISDRCRRRAQARRRHGLPPHAQEHRPRGGAQRRTHLDLRPGGCGFDQCSACHVLLPIHASLWSGRLDMPTRRAGATRCGTANTARRAIAARPAAPLASGAGTAGREPPRSWSLGTADTQGVLLCDAPSLSTLSMSISGTPESAARGLQAKYHANRAPTPSRKGDHCGFLTCATAPSSCTMPRLGRGFLNTSPIWHARAWNENGGLGMPVASVQVRRD